MGGINTLYQKEDYFEKRLKHIQIDAGFVSWPFLLDGF